jgi:N6-adenosine-specific RNA methylase IME4/Trp operon repressor
MNETPDTVHGRLLEAVHLSGYTFERAFSELEWLLDEDRWKRIGGGFTDINAFLATIDLSEFRLAIEQRKKIAKRLQEIEASQRATARLLGVDHVTIGRDLRGANAPLRTDESAENEALEETDGANAPLLPAWFQDEEIDPAKLAKKQQTRKESGDRRQERLAEISAGNRELGTAVRYPIIYADPPWRYENPPIGASGRSIENHYPTMTLDEIRALPVAELATEDAILYLWATAPKLAECLQVIEAWSFAYRTCMVWDKQIIGMGYHARNQHELLLIARRGEMPPPLAGTQPSSIYSERRGEHSAKPLFFQEMIERAYPGCAKIELFARTPRSGWDSWGNQAEVADVA